MITISIGLIKKVEGTKVVSFINLIISFSFSFLFLYTFKCMVVAKLRQQLNTGQSCTSELAVPVRFVDMHSE